MSSTKTTLQKIKPLARDLFILITGIMLSFLLNECRENRSARGEEKRVIEQLLVDLKADTAHLNELQASMQEVGEIIDKILTPSAKPSTPEELQFALIAVASFVPFEPQRTALFELMYQNQSGNIRQGEIVSKAIALHEGTYATMNKVTDLHANYILEHYMPFYHRVVPAAWNRSLTPAEAREMTELVTQNREMINQLSWLSVLLVNLDEMYDFTRAEAIKVLHEVEAAYS